MIYDREFVFESALEIAPLMSTESSLLHSDLFVRYHVQLRPFSFIDFIAPVQKATKGIFFWNLKYYLGSR